jgi:DNA primase
MNKILCKMTNNLKEQLLNQINILDLAKQLGLNPNKDHFIKSIYKDEKSPSLKLYPQTNTYKCYSTGQGGDIFELYAVTQNLNSKQDFKQILDELAGLYGITNDKPQIKIQDKKEIRNQTEYKIPRIDGQKYNNIYQKLIEICPLSGDGLTYLINRGFNSEFLKSKSIGYIKKNDYTRISDILKAKFSVEDLQLSGLFNESGKFKGYLNSIVIPYLNAQKEPKNLQFRMLEPLNSQKYLFLKNIQKVAYGLDELVINVDFTISPNVYFTEGVFDCLQIQQIDGNAIALTSAGDSKLISDIHLKEIINAHTKLILAFDNDQAGQHLTQEFGKRLFKLGARNILTKPLPEGIKDINEYLLTQTND